MKVTVTRNFHIGNKSFSRSASAEIRDLSFSQSMIKQMFTGEPERMQIERAERVAKMLFKSLDDEEKSL